MVTGLATASHLGHVGMQLMVESHRLVKVGDLIDNERIRSFTYIVLCVCGRHHQRRTWLEAHILGCWPHAGVALQAVGRIGDRHMTAKAKDISSTD